MTADSPERQLVLSYAPTAARAGLAALLALDDTLSSLLRTSTDPALGQLRLAWWRESLAKLDHAPAPAEPVLKALQQEVVARGISPKALVPLVHGWEVLVEEEHLDSEALTRFAEGRGQLFAAAGSVLGAAPTDPLAQAGRGWALVDLAANLSRQEEAAAARTHARPLLAEAARRHWSRNGRPLGAMAHLARMKVEGDAGPVARIGRLLWHRLSGR
ncbi:squalene/phytoene synthase family protein [Sphingomonas sp. IC-56]|uniref:squalene/phytoene synthase family protein n=1 Tax=Sphingomonas sp. IC-56 TaxID=2898529 RepID=UPI001E5A16B0|nr:squalene/phytoene synthase family protein [Sphingomonas sp. IC-56]